MQSKGILVLLLIVLAVGFPLIYFAGSNSSRQQFIQTITLAGSTTVFPIAEAWGQKLETYHSNLDIQISAGGSSVGISSVAQGLCDMGMASRQVKSSELATWPSLKNYTVALDGIAVVVHPSLAGKINNLTLTQIKMIYNGTITNWNQLNGSIASAPIVRAGRATTSGTYEFFYDHVMKKDPNYGVDAEFEANAGVQGYVQTTPNSIGYVGMGYLTGVQPLYINVGGILWYPTITAVQNNSYPIARPLFLVTNGEPTTGSLAEMFLNFALSPQGQAIVLAEDYVPLP